MSTELIVAVVIGLLVVAAFYFLRGGSSKKEKTRVVVKSAGSTAPRKPVVPQEYTKEEVAKHNKKDDLWLIVEGKVFDVSRFVGVHPGGEAIMKYPGMDNSATFFHDQHPDSVRDQLNEYFIGTVKK